MKLFAKPRGSDGLIILLVSVFLMGEIVAASASDFCSSINQLMDHSNSVPEDTAENSNQNDAVNRKVLRNFRASSCKVSKSTWGNSYQCVWKFQLQSSDATRKFREIEGNLVECMKPGDAMKSDKGVNHPDSYDAIRFNLENADVTVSLKDKSTLQSTFVNLWVLPIRR